MQKPCRFGRVAVGLLASVVSLLPGAAQAIRGQEPERFIAYEVPAGTLGNQDVGGIALGMDFDVQLDIVITRLGVFDSGSDGLATPIVARLYDRDDTSAEVASVEFTPEDPGDLVGGSRFKELTIGLPAGFRGSIVAAGYNGLELNGNSHGVEPSPLGLTTNDGGCAILFTGGGRFGSDGVSFPGSADGGPPNRYAAGTFEYYAEEQWPGFTDGIAYHVPAGTIGNQNANVPLGHDFDVNTAIFVTRLGVFDSGSDGLATPLSARIFHRPTMGELAHLDFTPEDPGELIDGSRFKDLDPPLSLPPGFEGTIVGEGYNDLELNGNQGVGPVDGLTLDGGGCAIRFVGGGRFGSTLGTYPGSRDAGPPNRYAAGTFAFEIDETPPPPPPDPPANFQTVAGDGKIDLSWEPPTGVTPAALYRVLRAPSAAGPFVQIAETALTQYSDTPLPNDVVVCYVLRSVSATGVESFDSSRRCDVPAGPQPGGRSIAYVVPAGTNGNQDAGVALGMDFDVTEDITVTRLGVFDDGSNGLNLPIAARLFDRDTQTELAMIQFLPDDPGVLIGGSRFKALDAPLDLFSGFHGTMVASGYGGAERNGNRGLGPLDMSTDDGGCRISFVGTARFGADPAGFPGVADGGPADRYAAGTFEFEPLGPPFVPMPQPPVIVTAEVQGAAIDVSWQPAPDSGCTVPATSYKVFRSVGGGPPVLLTQLAETALIDSDVQPDVDYCYSVRAVADALESGDSAVACATGSQHIAYVVPGGTAGSLVDGFPLGMDFDVQLDAQVTRLGAFDSMGDGLQSTITVRLLNRETEEELASLVFSPEDPGTLLNGSRFKPLVPPLDLPAGLKCAIVAEGYGLDEPAGTGGPWFTNPGPCTLFFTGVGRSVPGGSLLPLQDAAGRPDQYAAGTLAFKPMESGTPRDAIAYVIPAGTVGNQDYAGPLGHDFNVNVPITVTRLGVFDSGSDGLVRPLVARLFDRRTRTSLAELSFTPEEPGELVDGSRFKPLDPPLELPAGFRGTMSGAGYGAGEPNGNGGGQAAGVPWTVDDGGCAITFVGLGRFGAVGADYPSVADGGPVNRYAAGTFEFEVESGPPPTVFHRGDSNNDGKHNISDPVNTLNVLFLGTGSITCQDAADSNDDNLVNISDPVNSLNVLFLGIGEIPPPAVPEIGPCGPDPTVAAEDIGCEAYTQCG